VSFKHVRNTCFFINAIKKTCFINAIKKTCKKHMLFK
jgi:hypothetical protein